MKVENNKDSKIIKFLNGKTFYVVMAICFIAVGVAAWAGLQGLKEADKNTPSGISSGSTANKTPSSPLPSIPEITEKEEPVPSTSDKDKNDNDDKDKDKENISEPESEAAGGTVAAFFIKPILGNTLKGYSDTELQYSMTYGDMRLHKALDIAAEAGTPVTSAGNGKVTAVFLDPLLGSVVEIDHGNGITAKYCGLNKVPSVKVGDTVDSSTQLGTIDVIPCESVEKRHLHLEFYLNGKPVSPADYISE